MDTRTKRWLVAAAILLIAGLLALQVYSAHMGMHRYRKGDPRGALPLLKVARALNPFSVKVQVALADIYIIDGQPQRARELLLNVIDRNPENARTYNLLGVLSQTKGNFGEAKEYYNKAISANPDFALAQFNLGYLFLRQGDIEKGKELIEKAVKLDPKLEANRDEVFRRLNLAPVESPSAFTPEPESPR